MTNITPTMRLKVKRDTFYLPDSNGGVYFRNNESSFRMEGSTIIQWIEKLLPMFNGEHSLRDLTDGLPGPHKNRLFEIAEVLYRNGFVRDVSQDRPHQLTEHLLRKYGSQIEFIDQFGDSGAYRFQSYRQIKVLAIGSGPFLTSLISALLESGLPKFQLFITDSIQTDRKRIKEIVEHARKTDSEVEVEELVFQKNSHSSWREIIQPFECILFVSQEGNIEKLRDLHSLCKQENKMFIPAICLQNVGLAGPVVFPNSDVEWESAWHRVHQSVIGDDQQFVSFSSTSGAMLSNVLVFELFKETTKVSGSEQSNQLFLLDLETLEGSWHPYLTHPLVSGEISANWVQDFNQRLLQKSSKHESGKLFMFFNEITSMQVGIFHTWDEGDLNQIPLAQCRVQVVDPMSIGPAKLLPEMICTGLTHEEVRREAGLAGIEAYASRTVSQLVKTLPDIQENLVEFVGVGTGETFAESICRGLQKCLENEFEKQDFNQEYRVVQMNIESIKDGRCLFYLQALHVMQGAPKVGLGSEIYGFPVVWIVTRDNWYGSIGLNKTMALRNALQQAIKGVQDQLADDKGQGMKTISMLQEEVFNIPLHETMTQLEILRSAMTVLARNRKQLQVFEMELEPSFKEELAGVFGVLVREEESR